MKSKTLFSLAISAILTVSPIVSLAAPGDLDPTFNGTGSVHLPGGIAGIDLKRMLEIQADGKILAGFSTNGFTNTNIARYLPSGALDTSFGVGGVVDLIYPNGDRVPAAAMKQLPDGKIILATYDIDGEIIRCGLGRLNANGSVDTTFGTNGRVMLNTANRGCLGLFDMALQADGKILLTGEVEDDLVGPELQDAFLMRFNPDGSPDTTFDQDGYVITDFGLNDDHPTTVIAQPDGKILLVGYNGEYISHFVGRYHADGSMDGSFPNGGRLIFGGVVGSGNSDAMLLPDGKILILGVNGGPTMGWGLIRLTADGGWDSSFGPNGYVFNSIEEFGAFNSSEFELQPDGKIVLGGSMVQDGDYPSRDFAVGRYNSNGTLDRAPDGFKFGRRISALGNFWGTNGTVRFGIASGTHADITSVKLDTAGRVVALGKYSSFTPGQEGVKIVRFQGDNSPYAEISGTVRSTEGLPIKNVYVTLIGGSLSQPVTAMSNQFGYFSFPGLPVTETYTVSVGSKRFDFPTPSQTFMLNGNLTDVTFFGGPMQ